SRRCSPGPGGSPSGTRRASPRSCGRRTGSPPTALWRRTGCCGSCSRTRRGPLPRPKLTPAWGGAPTRGPAFPSCSGATHRLGFDARRIRARGGPVVCEVVVNTLWSLSLQALGRPSATPALVDRLWDERAGAFFDEVQPGGERPAVLTCASLAPLA